ncbi:hypothetical protein SAMN05192566_2412 [Methylophilus rhizosphaerae]|uniref:Uncharacterized protein n=1 Tax=Methylophilus rhizosphaerae TaxID=492660 RepID=A0A1G9ERJ7_9PROT|nr:hypothetical protein [Methylophilus rhizosphaerae]SDK78693.1 hypothetical protein SAMN05192566_2412 [Methylophilus rhizosphaerae]
MMAQQSVQQINLSYDRHQDRLLLKTAINQDQEVRVWLTYRLVRQMFSVLNQEAHLPVAPAQARLADMPSPAEATRQFAQEAEAVHGLDTLDFDTAYQQRASSIGPALLAIEVRFVSINDQLHHMQLVCEGGANVNMGLNKEVVLAISRMLQIASKDAGWLLSAQKEPGAVSSIVMQEPTEKQVLH